MTLSHCLKRLAVAIAAALPLLVSADAHAGFGDLNMPYGVTPISHEAYDLHMLILVICVIIGIIVFGVMFISILNHRKSRGAVPAQFHHSTKAEIIWTVIPCLILIGMAIPATKGLVALEDMSNPAMTVKVTGFQWKWEYQYPASGITFYSSLSYNNRKAVLDGEPYKADHYLLSVDHPLVLPINQKVRILVTSGDVIHSWWVPAFGMKRDAIPGYINELWVKIEKPGTYRGQCAELCGKDHGFMPIVVVAKTEDEYKAWVAQQKAAMAASHQTAARALSTGGIY